MDNIQCYVIVSAYRRDPSVKDILEALRNPETKKYSQLSDAMVDFQKMFFDDGGCDVFGISSTDKIYSCGRTNTTIRYYKTISVINPEAPSGYGSVFWIERHEDYVQYYDKDGYFLDSVSRLGFIPNQSVKLANKYGNTTLYPSGCYPMGKTHPSVGNQFYISTRTNTFYKSPCFWKRNGTIVEHWHNKDAEFDANGYLISLLECR